MLVNDLLEARIRLYELFVALVSLLPATTLQAGITRLLRLSTCLFHLD